MPAQQCDVLQLDCAGTGGEGRGQSVGWHGRSTVVGNKRDGERASGRHLHLHDGGQAQHGRGRGLPRATRLRILYLHGVAWRARRVLSARTRHLGIITDFIAFLYITYKRAGRGTLTLHAATLKQHTRRLLATFLRFCAPSMGTVVSTRVARSA